MWGLVLLDPDAVVRVAGVLTSRCDQRVLIISGGKFVWDYRYVACGRPRDISVGLNVDCLKSFLLTVPWLIRLKL